MKPGQTCSARVQASDDSRNPLTYSWDLEESTDLKTGGDYERKPERVPDSIQDAHASDTTIKAPAKPGAYRLFAYVYNGKGRAAHANIPFYVDPPARPLSSTQ